MFQSKYPHLFSPIQIRGKTFKNRICALERLEQLYEIVEELKQTVSEE